MNNLYQCPVCQQTLLKVEKSFQCENKHSYDISREGYLNLLLANQKKTKDPGDSKFMIENRTCFLEQGHYDNLSHKVNEIVSEFIKNSQTQISGKNILDIGCGEGFYSDRLYKDLETNKLENKVQILGIDISKSAIQKAAKRNSDLQFCIGSNFNLPYLDQSFDFIFSIFSPLDVKECQRVLKSGGKLLLVRPGPAHLQELGSLLYDQFQLQGSSAGILENFDTTKIITQQLKYQIQLKNNKEIMSLVTMTPYYWHMDKEKNTLLEGKQQMLMTVDFQLSFVF